MTDDRFTRYLTGFELTTLAEALKLVMQDPGYRRQNATLATAADMLNLVQAARARRTASVQWYRVLESV